MCKFSFHKIRYYTMEPALDSDSETHLKKIGTVEQIRGKTLNGPPCIKCTCYFLFGKLNYNILSDEVRNQMSGKLPQELNYLQIIIFLIQREFLRSSIFISRLKNGQNYLAKAVS